MIKPQPEIVRQVASVATQHPDVLEWLQDWYQRELEQLPLATNNVALSQGRCQVLAELTKFMQESPVIAAKSK